MRIGIIAVLLVGLSISFASAQIPTPKKKRTVTAPTPGVLETPQIRPAERDKVATQSTWSFLSLQAAEAETFLKDHPTYDGRGVIVVILDTGVEPDLPGLRTTTLGKIKIIDVQNYSGTGDERYREAERMGDDLLLDGHSVLRGLNGMKITPPNGKYYYAVLKEREYQNGLGDLNLNGSDDDEFGILIFEDTPGHFVAYVDSDGDGNISDEKQLASYHERFDTFHFHAHDSTGAEIKSLGGAVNFLPDQHIVSVYFDDGSHGTHVAGIAAGHDIDGASGFNGLAPGAEVVGIKFADNTAGGVTVSGSMKRGFEYAARLAKSSSKPVVLNMSFGVGSELEGQSVMDKWLDSLLEATPELTVCIAAGNEGPGLSTIGLPGSADRIISSGAALPDDAARDLYGARLKAPIVWDFSSRGGELAKPDVVSPGTAVSTVPDYVSGDRYNGTSMASPFTTGCVALLLSGMKQAFPTWHPNAVAIRRALMLSAVPISGETPLDIGFGEVNVPRAFELLSEWERSGYHPQNYKVISTIPSAVHRGSAAYFRAGLPTGDDFRTTFRIIPTENASASPRAKAIGFEAFDLVSDADWIIPIESSIYRRGEGMLRADVTYDAEKVAKPGMYCGRVWAYPKGAGHKHVQSESAFELLSTVITPYTFTPQNNFKVTIVDIKKSKAMSRYFFSIPSGTKEVRMFLSGPENAFGQAQIFDNDGQELNRFGFRSGELQRASVLTMTGDELRPGVWEVDIRAGQPFGDETSPAITFEMQVLPMDIAVLDKSIDSEGHARATFQLTNGTTSALDLQSDAEIFGYERYFDTTISTGDEFSMPFAARTGEASVKYTLALSREDWGLFTDITCQVLKPDSSAELNSAFENREKEMEVTFEPGNHDPFKLYFRGGLANPEKPQSFKLHIREVRTLDSATAAVVAPPLKSVSPQETMEYELQTTHKLPPLPAGYHFIGNVRMRHGTDATIKFPITF